jgi:2-amino-4-hydroxy-6-hydroxymethyldihydropteridine diphosphokinase
VRSEEPLVEPRRSLPRGSTRVAIALGSNIGDRASHLRYAVDRLSAVLTAVRVSPFIDTEPQGVGPQPAFLNGALVGAGRLNVRELLFLLQTIEHERGRERPHVGAPRTLDLDLILFGTAIIDEPGLTVPHPRFRDRAFVLQPLAAIAPDMTDPVTGLTIEALWRRVEAP